MQTIKKDEIQKAKHNQDTENGKSKITPGVFRIIV